MNKIYLIAPLLGCLIFGGVYWNATKGFKAKAEAKVAAEVAQRKEKIASDKRDRDKAVADALVAQDKRKKEREEKDAKDRADKQARVDATDARDKAARDQDKFNKQVERLKKEIDAEKEVIAKIQKDKELSVAEEKFLKEFVGQAEANVKALQDLLNKIAAAEAARAAAEAAAIAAAAAKKAS